MKCCICQKEIDQMDANNAEPYASNGQCCNECNWKHVIPARMAAMNDKQQQSV